MTKKKTAIKRKDLPAKSKDLERKPEYVVHLSDPKMIRRDVLESLREVIVFMQGYESFKKLQEDKVALFAQLKNDLRQLTGLMDIKLRRYFPRGKDAPAEPEMYAKTPVSVKKDDHDEGEKPVKVVQKPVKPAPPPQRIISKSSELDELEAQLQEIEGKLKAV